MLQAQCRNISEILKVQLLLHLDVLKRRIHEKSHRKSSEWKTAENILSHEARVVSGPECFDNEYYLRWDRETNGYVSYHEAHVIPLE